jgi:hypothetical protein
MIGSIYSHGEDAAGVLDADVGVMLAEERAGHVQGVGTEPKVCVIVRYRVRLMTIGIVDPWFRQPVDKIRTRLRKLAVHPRAAATHRPPPPIEHLLVRRRGWCA